MKISPVDAEIIYLSVNLCVRLSERITLKPLKPHDRTLPNFVPVACGRGIGPPLPAVRYAMHFRFYGGHHCHAIKHDVMFARTSQRGSKPTSHVRATGRPIAHMQSCCTDGPEHVTLPGSLCTSRLEGRLSAYRSTKQLIIIIFHSSPLKFGGFETPQCCEPKSEDVVQTYCRNRP